MSQYQHLHSQGDIPAFPPSYDELGPQNSDVFHSGPPIEQFEIDEDEVYEPAKRESLVKRALFATRKFAYTFRDRVGGPVARYMDPLCEGYKYFHMKYELFLLKLGNPLVVKRLIYVFFVIMLMYFVTLSENSDGVNGASGGAFSMGKFYDVDMLGNTIKLYIEAATLKENLEYLSSMPHLAGTTGDLALARYVESYFHNNGIQLIDFHELESFLNYPKKEGTYLKLGDGSFSATLSEGSDDQMEKLAFSPNSPSTKGEISAKYVYANYGDPEDIIKLDEARVSVKDAILLIRYGGKTPEANKVFAASRLGAAAVVFISPSIEWAGKSHDDMIQRKNVGLTRYCYGDVLTPGWSSHSNYFGNLAWEKSNTTPKIPTIPISWKDGKTLIEKLGKSGADFGDGLYSGEGSDENTLKLNVQHEERITHLIWNVVGSIRGREQATKGIIIGAARDAMGHGASSSASSTATLLELVKIFTSLQRRFDWYPSRSIYFASFDATEYNLGGAGEWLEEKREQLAEEGYAYIDINDIAVGDQLTIQSNPLLHGIIKDELKKIELPEKDKKKDILTLYDLFKSQNGGNDRISNNMVEVKNYVPFINSLNIPSMNLGFRGKDVPQGSVLDNFHNFEKELDSSMEKHIQMVELLARVCLRLAEEPMLPFDLIGLAERLSSYQKDLEKYANDKIALFRSSIKLDYSRLTSAIQESQQHFRDLDRFANQWREFITSTSPLEPATLANTRKECNVNMMEFSLNFVVLEGHISRVGYHNSLFGTPYDAPAFDNGSYEWNTFPMVRDLVAEGKFDKAQAEINRLADVLSRSASGITENF